jgi:hypothetical protein
MSNNKQSSVIWFAIESWKLGMQLQNQEISKDKHSVLWVDLLVKAKAKHEEDINEYMITQNDSCKICIMLKEVL